MSNKLDPKEKAREILDMFIDTLHEANGTGSGARECAELAIDQIIKTTPMYVGNLNPEWSYWMEVKKEVLTA